MAAGSPPSARKAYIEDQQDVAMSDTAQPIRSTAHSNLQSELRAASTHPAQEMSSPNTAPAEPDVMSVDPQDNAEVDTENINALGGKVKSLVQTIDKLQQLGIETSGLPLPKIVVVGDQSAGKSSLIEGISGIKVPRSSGTCTRCPLHITLTGASDGPASPWVCKITLQPKYSLYSGSGTSRTASPLGHWHANDTWKELHFLTVYNIHDLEEALRRAQIATLNPGADPRLYLTADSGALEVAVGFSPNPIRLEISGPDLPNLSFFDLPGIINQTGDEDDKWLVGLVKALVVEHINQESSLILLACSMENDIQNSSASALVAACRGANERTVAVLTKPDRFPDGTGDNHWRPVESILDNRSFRVGHGYFVTKQPSQRDLDDGISREKARVDEEKYFSKAPWSTRFARHHSRFGTTQLRDALSQKLTEQIIMSLPSITAKVLLRLNKVEVELSQHPDPPPNACNLILEALSNFKTAVNRHVEGIHPHNDLRNSLRRITVAFEEELHGQRPGFFASTPAGYEKRVISLLTDDEGSDDECSVTSTTLKTPSKSHKRPHHEESPTKRPRIEEPSANDIKTPLGMQSLLGTPHTGQTQRGPTKLRLRLNQIRETLADLSLSNIPSETDPRAVDHLRSQSIMGWEPPMDRFLKRVGERLQVSLDHLLAEACDGWLTTEFYKESRQMLRTFLSTIMSQQREHAHRALRLEMAQPLTMNEEGFESHRTKELSRLEDERLTRRVFEDLKKKERDTAADRDATRERHEALFKRAKDEKKLRDAMDAKPDPFQREVEAMASVLGYYNVALVRFLDHIVQGIHGEALHQCREELSRQLRAGLMVDSPEAQDNCMRLLAEHPEREARRLQLKKERSNLLEAHQWLMGLDC